MGILYILNPLQSHKKSYDVTVSTISKEIPDTEKKYQKGEKQPVWKCRYVVVLIGFFLYFYLNAYRINMSVNIVAMVNSSALTTANKTESDSCPHLKRNTTEFQNETDAEEDGDFNWSYKIQGYIVSSYFIGYSIAPLPVGSLIERYGCKWFIFAGSFISGVGTLLVPFFSWLDVYALIVLQTCRGLSQGVVPPSLTLLTANWFPKLERGFFFTIMQSGAALGSCLGGLFAGYLCDSLRRWPSSFYVFGVGGLLLSAVILFFAVESPNEHRKISKAELNFILNNQETTLNRRRPRPPWSKIIRSVPVYAAAFGCFGQMWAISQFMLVHSTFLGTILHYPIAQNGLLSAAPFILQFFCSQVGGWFSSFMLRKKFAGVDFLRKFFNLISCLGYSGCLVGICFAGCDRELSSLFSVLSTGFTGFGFAGAFIISADMSPKFAGTMMAICCTSACLSGVILPVIVGHLTEKTQTIEQWNKVFFITIAVVLSSGIAFAVFGSAEVQPWNYDEDDASNKSENAKHINSDKKTEMNTTEEIHPDRKKSVDIEIKLTKF